MGELAVPTRERLLSIIEMQNAIASMNAPADDVMRMAAERAAGLTGGTGGAIALVEGDDLVYRAVAGTSRTSLGARLSMTTTHAGRCMSDRKAMRSDDAGGKVADVPIMYGEHPVGVIEVVGDHAFDDEDLDTLKLLSSIVAIALHKAHSYPRPRYDSTHDALTGLENRRAFEERVLTELGRSKRYGQSFSLALLDLDGFQTASDRLGVATGEQILRDIAAILKAQTRVIDACFRLSGDEFAVVMPGTALEGACILAERCRAQITEAKLGDNGITSSFGVVESTGEVAADELVTRALAALAADKDKTRVSQG